MTTNLSNEKLADLEIVVEALSDASYEGVAVVTLAKQVGIGANELEKLFAKANEFVIRVGSTGSRYRLNPFGPNRGNIDAIRRRISDLRAKKRQQMQVLPFLFGLYIGTFVLGTLLWAN